VQEGKRARGEQEWTRTCRSRVIAVADAVCEIRAVGVAHNDNTGFEEGMINLASFTDLYLPLFLYRYVNLLKTAQVRWNGHGLRAPGCKGDNPNSSNRQESANRGVYRGLTRVFQNYRLECRNAECRGSDQEPSISALGFGFSHTHTATLPSGLALHLTPKRAQHAYTQSG